jgi:hypothetical protein
MNLPLTDTELQEAVKELSDDTFISKFPRTDRLFQDPIYNNQIYCLHSFVPTEGAIPDKNGLFGFIKCRGSFLTDTDAKERASWLIRNVDSVHTIQTSYSGRPFPVCKDSIKFMTEQDEIDIKKKTIETISKDIKSRQEEDSQIVKDIHQREENLLKQSKEVVEEKYVEDPLETYTTMRVKKANLVWTYVNTRNKMEEIKKSILKTREEIAEMDDEHKEFDMLFYEKYNNARKEVGLSTEDVNSDNDNFIKYMCDDLDLGF